MTIFQARVAILGFSLYLSARSSVSQELPQPCGTGTCGTAGPSVWITDGRASAIASASTLRIQQQSDNVTLNWASFNIGRDGRVVFEQPGVDSLALNRIFQADPSQIFGALEANGRVFLINQNGILFGEGAQVNVGGLIATTLDQSDAAREFGFARAVSQGNQPALQPFPNGAPSGSVVVDEGAVLQTANGGQVLLFAPNVVNDGKIAAPGGQVMLGAGERVYLVPSTDSNLRGFVVQLDGAGTVTNGSGAPGAPNSASISAPTGNVTLAGLAVNQNGRVSATTAVQANGSIRLQAQEGTMQQNGNTLTIAPRRNGTVTLAANSVTEALPATADTARAVDINAQQRSTIDIEGEQVVVGAQAAVRAPSGIVRLVARSNPGDATQFDPTPDASRIVIKEGATVDVSGLTVDLPSDRNLVTVELRGNQLRDSPVQRDGPLRGKKVVVDIRDHGVREDGTAWQGTPLADASGEIATITRDVRERSLTGGTVELVSHGSLFMLPGSLVDVSGGSINYLPGVLTTSLLMGQDGKAYDIASADPDRVYTGIVTSFTREHKRWGVTEVFPGFAPYGRVEPGYVEGKSAGTLSVLAPRAVFGGDLRGETVIGPLQRFAPTPGQNLFDHRPNGPALVVGGSVGPGGPNTPNSFAPNYVAPGVKLDFADVLAALGSEFDPLEDSIPDQWADIHLSPEMLRSGGIARLAISSNGDVVVPTGSLLTLPIGGALDVTAARIRVLDSVTIPGGRISLAAGPTATQPVDDTGLTVGSGVKLSTAGLWTNDSDALGVMARAPIALDGGSVDLSVEFGVLDLEPSTVDVSGGLWLDSNGHLHGGAAGSVRIAALPSLDAKNPIRLGARLTGFGFEEGGEASFELPSVCIGCAADGAVTLDPSLFASGGFAKWSVTATAPEGIALAAGIDLTLRHENLAFSGNSLLVPSGPRLLDFMVPSLLPDEVRRPTDLTLTGGPVELGTGSRVLADPLATIEIESDARIVADGVILARGGVIDFILNAQGAVSGFDPTMGIWLGAHADLQVGGVLVPTPNDLGVRTGRLHGGGTVRFQADRGYIVTAPNSRIDVSGTSATLDIATRSVAAKPAFEPRLVASAAGTIDLTSAEGMILSGVLDGWAAAAPGAAGGVLNVTIDANRRNDPGGATAALFPLAERQIQIAQRQDSFVIPPEGGVPAAMNGRALLSADLVANGGFDSVGLTVRSLFETRETGTVLASAGKVVFDGNVHLQADRAIMIDAALVEASQGITRLEASYVSIGGRDREFQYAAPTVAAGQGTFAVDADLIELVGTVSLSNAAVTALHADELRLQGIQKTFDRSIAGLFQVSGDVDIRADVIYPTTLSSYEIRALDTADAPSSLTIERGDGQAPVLFSAAGVVRLTAHTIRQNGTVRAPLGSVELNATDLVLGNGSITSTSLDDLAIPFGTIQAGTDWVYGLLDTQTLVFDSTFPQQRVTLNGRDIGLVAGATIDVSGSGDLVAYEWIPGVGGSRDVLSPSVSPNTFAILPGVRLPFAPFDPAESSGVNLTVGDNVVLAAFGDLPAGEYTLLPARYGLLPGAYLVEAIDGYQDIGGEHFSRLDGSTVIAGRRSVARTGTIDSRTSGFAVRPGQDVLRDADYELSFANDFIAKSAAERNDLAPRLPFDSGTLSVFAAGTLRLDGLLHAQPATGGRGAHVDISSERLRVVSSGAAAGEPGEVLIDAARLSALGAESVLLGGTRSATTAQGTAITAAATSVRFDANTVSSAPELLVIARDSISVATSAVVRASGSVIDEPGTFLLSGDSAFLGVSAGARALVERTPSPGDLGTVTLEAGSRLAATGSTTLDSSRRTVLDGDLESQGALWLGASQITIGGAPAPLGLSLSSEQLDALNLRDLSLTSRSTIDFAEDLTLDVSDRLALTATSLTAISSTELGSRTVTLSADSVTLSSTTAVPSAAQAGNGRLTIAAREELDLGSGAISGNGWSGIDLRSGGNLTASGDGTLLSAGEITLGAAALTASSGVAYSFDAASRLIILPDPPGEQRPHAAIMLTGGSLRFIGSEIEDEGRIELASGAASFLARSGSINVNSTAVIDVAGRNTAFDGVSVMSPGGEARFEALRGDINLRAGAVVDVSGGVKAGEGGRLSTIAASGTVHLEGDLRAAGEAGGSFFLDALFGDIGAFFSKSRSGGFHDELVLRQRGPGDIVLGAGQDIRARAVDLSADAGSIGIAGTITSSSTAGGRAKLSARNGVILDGRIDMRGTGGGEVEIDSLGAIQMASGAELLVGDAGGALLGDVRFRAPQTSLSDPAAISLAGRIEGATASSLELFNVYDQADGVLSADEVLGESSNPMFADAAALAASADTIRASVGRGDDSAFLVVPGIEVRAPGDLSLAAPWDLSTWRFNGHAGVLTLRAAGDLRIDQTLSDGFEGIAGSAPQLADPHSWSYRLAAGSDFSAADPLGLLSPTSLAANAGSLIVAPGVVTTSPTGTSNFRMIRTGTGFIDIAAAHNLVLSNRASAIYTAGVATPGVLFAGLKRAPYPEGGGDIRIAVRDDIVGAVSHQMVTDWLWRVGRPVGSLGASPTAWTVGFPRFEQNIGALAGGDVSIRAGGNITNLSAVVPTVGRRNTSGTLDVLGGGNLTVTAGGNIGRGSFYVGRGTGTLRAGNSIGDVTGGVLLGVSDGSFDLQARRDVAIESVINPTMLPQGAGQAVAAGNISFFSTYSGDAAVNATSAAGDVSLSNDATATGWMRSTLTSMPLSNAATAFLLALYPPTLRAHALRGDVVVNDSFSMFPGSKADLELFAGGSLKMTSPSFFQLLMSDSDATALPNVTIPDTSPALLARAFQSALVNDPILHANVPIHSNAAQADGVADTTPVRFVAGEDILFQTQLIDNSTVSLPKPLRAIAGRDIRDLSARIQNNEPNDISLFAAGRDFTYSVGRLPGGALTTNPRQILQSGPGQLEVIAGRDVDLRASSGIASNGDLLNPALPTAGASIIVAAGLGDVGMDVDSFITDYLTADGEYADELVAYVAAITGEPLSAAAAIGVFRSLSFSQQLPFIKSAFLAEVRASGRAAAAAGPTNGDFSRVFTALDTLFPGSNPDLDAGEVNPYDGDVNLYFSRVYTLDGGDVSFLVPGGLINAGLATPPASFGIVKAASELGIVAQREGSIQAFAYGDILVNESRVFAADGGDILLWSTRGDIDAGRGAKTAISSPPPEITIDAQGTITTRFPPALAGSGIQTLATSEGRKPGNVDLFAPRGVVNAGDAGIVAGNLTIAATAVLGADNISVSGVSVGVPVDTGGFAAALSGVSGVASSASNAAEDTVAASRQEQESATPLSDTALGFLDVFVTGFGDSGDENDDCEPGEANCPADP